MSSSPGGREKGHSRQGGHCHVQSRGIGERSACFENRDLFSIAEVLDPVSENILQMPEDGMSRPGLRSGVQPCSSGEDRLE